MSNSMQNIQIALNAAQEEFQSLTRVLSDTRNELDLLKRQCGIFPPGHFYSPIPSLETLERHLENANQPFPSTLPDINLNVQGQLDLLEQFKQVSNTIPFPLTEDPAYRYFYENGYYFYADAITLFCMLNTFKPTRLIEIGSGFSSFLSLDTNDLCLNQQIRMDFIEPYPDRLLTKLKPHDLVQHTLHQKAVQDVDLALFTELNAGDILLVDSTHVSKLNSDVNHILFNILPVLKPGVFIHFHDIFYPFENCIDFYKWPSFWNEVYMLRSFLMNNDAYKIRFFCDFMRHFHADALEAVSPLFLKHSPSSNWGSTLWLEKQ